MTPLKNVAFETVDLIFGRSFWPMILRFALFPIVLSVIVSPLLYFFPPEDPLHLSPVLSFLSYVYLLIFQMIFWSWVGWGAAFWRFDRQEIPARSFIAYPFFSGFAIIPVYWILLASVPDRGIDGGNGAIIAGTVFGMIFGPLMAMLFVAMVRGLLQYTTSGKKNPQWLGRDI